MSFVGVVLFGAASLVVPGANSAKPSHQLQTARFFYEPENSGMLHAVRQRMDKRITFNGHFSQSYVSCGLACGTFFFVDRWTGGVVVAPEGSPPKEMTWDIASKPNSDLIKVIFGPMDGVGPGCSEQHFRLSGHKFVAIDRRSAIRCPK
jgi:hypothetical protein